ncbi:ComEC/Rec2 family competence protein, partial [Kitasatospora sp. NPDC004240]
MTADLRLLAPALAAWAVTALTLPLGPGHGTVLTVAALAACGAGVLLLVRPSPRCRDAAITAAAVLLTGAAATAATLLHTADLYRGPLPELARPAASVPGDPDGPSPPAPEVSVELTVTGDPRSRTSRTRGTNPGRALLTVEAVVDRVTLPGRPEAATRTRTPVTVMVRAPDTGPWQPLLPSTRLAVEATVVPPGERGAGESSAVLLAHGPPRVLAGPGLPHRIAGRLRAGLRSATDGLPSDARGLLPGLVVGDTSRLPDDLRDAFRATDMAHLTAVSGANLAIVLGVLLGAPGRAGSTERRGLAALFGIPLRATAVLGAVVTLGFVLLCRPEPSVLRAAGTGLIGLLALATGRPRQALPALAGTTLLLVLLDPQLARSYGFLLSVLATGGLLLLGPRWARALRARGWPAR